MIGLIVLPLIGLWIWANVRIAQELASRAPKHRQMVVRMAALLVLFSIPFVDEVIGMIQFKDLCSSHGIESVDISRAKGKKVTVHYSARTPLDHTIVPIMTDQVTFRAADTGELLIKHQNYYASGGWLKRYTPLGMGSDSPMVFSGNGCGFGMESKIFAAAQITIVN